MKIDSYEPFHIGSKFIYYVNRSALMSKIYDYYESINQKKDEALFDLNKEVIEKDIVISPKLNIVTKRKTKTSIQINFGADALNVVGNNFRTKIVQYDGIEGIYENKSSHENIIIPTRITVKPDMKVSILEIDNSSNNSRFINCNEQNNDILINF